MSIKNLRIINVFILSAVFSFILLLSCKTDNKDKSDHIEYQLLKLYYENSSGENGLTTFDYDEKGILDKAIWELSDGSRMSLNFYKHDKNGNLISKYREFSDSLTSNQFYEYDDHGNLIKETFQRSDSVSGRTNYEYDKNGQLIHADCSGLNGWFYGEINYIYDETGRKQKADIIQKGKNTGIILYAYDGNNNLIKEYWDFSGQWSQTFIYEYEKCQTSLPQFYTSSNVFIINNSEYRIVKESYDYADKIGGPSYYIYNKNGKLLNKRFERSDGFSTETAYLYDHRGQLTKSYRKYSNGLCAVFTYEFNNLGKLIKRSFKRTDGMAGSESYDYDEKLKLTHANWENFDSWLTGSIEFRNNKNGDLSEGYFHGINGFDAKINFKYDKTGNLIKIYWNFSFGEIQTYLFAYE
jgi:hypothetical protein